jgi:hypothetical protein
LQALSEPECHGLRPTIRRRDRGRESETEAGLEDRIRTVGGDFFADARFPEGHDVILLSMILHD